MSRNSIEAPPSGNVNEGLPDSAPGEPPAEAHDAVAKWLHWTMAALMLTAWAAMSYRLNFTSRGEPARAFTLDIHMLAGATVGALVLPRIWWRLRHRRLAPAGANRLENLAAVAVHYGLYALMVVMPVTGYLGTGRSINVLGLFTITRFDQTAVFQRFVVDGLGLGFPEWERPIDLVHKQIGGEVLLPVLVFVHVGAALFHHFWRRDTVLLRMLPRGRATGRTG